LLRIAKPNIANKTTADVYLIISGSIQPG